MKIRRSLRHTAKNGDLERVDAIKQRSHRIGVEIVEPTGDQGAPGIGADDFRRSVEDEGPDGISNDVEFRN